MATTKTTTVATKPGSYSESDIKNLQFPESIRLRPTLFIGPTDERGVLHIKKELLDNTVDEALAGRASECWVHVGDNEYWVADNGQGVPVRNIAYKDVMGNTHKVSAFKAAFAIPDTSGKYEGKAYAASRGTHGLGAKATNALSDEFEAWTFREGRWFHMLYKKGIEVTPVHVTSKAPKLPGTTAAMKRGTLVRFKPDMTIFKMKKFPLSSVVEWATIAAFFTPKFKVNLSLAGGKNKQFYFPNGPIDYIHEQVEKLKAVPLADKAFIISGDKTVDCVVQFTNHGECEFHGFTNGLRNVEGGVHVNAFYKALYAALEPYTKRGQEFKPDDLKEGLVGIVNAKMSHPQFDSQTKEKLVDERANKPLLAVLTKEMTAFFAKNKALALQVIEQAVKLRDLHNKFKLSKTATREIKKLMKSGFPSTAIMAPNVPPHQRELILIEGESAKSSAGHAKMPWQEVLPLKGKILNCVAGDTLVHLVDGTQVPIASLAEPWWGVGFNTETKQYEINKMCEAFTQRQATELVELTFDDGTILKCTPDHLILTKDRGYVTAEELLPTDELECYSLPSLEQLGYPKP